MIPIAPYIGEALNGDRYNKAIAVLQGLAKDNNLSLRHPKTLAWAIATAKKMDYLCHIKCFSDIPLHVLEQMVKDGEARMIQKITEAKSA